MDDSIKILYASETGTAEEVAFGLYESLKPKSTNSKDCLALEIFSIDCYDIQLLPKETYMIFVVSTTGEGDPPHTMIKFWQFLLKKGLSSSALAKLNFAIFGLGDSSYEFFNSVSRKLFVRLKQLGAHEFLPLGLGDDQAKLGYFSSLNPWSESLLEYFKTMRDSCKSEISFEARGQEPYHVVILSENVFDFKTDRIIQKNEFIRQSFILEVVKNELMTANDWFQKVNHLVFQQSDLGNTQKLVSYLEGDVVEIFYENPNDLIAEALKYMNSSYQISSDAILDIRRSENMPRRPSRIQHLCCSLDVLIRSYLDIGAIPKRSFFKLLAQYASNDEEKEKLAELSSPEGTDLFFDYCIREKRSYLEVLKEFPSSIPPLNRLIDAIPLISPRQYSIASSPKIDPKKIDVCVALAEYKTPYKRLKYGQCSSFLNQLVAGSRVLARIKEGSLRRSSSFSFLQTSQQIRPLILIGPGTGVAPMRALIEHMAVSLDLESYKPHQPLAILFFGCRKKSKDYLFGEEWENINRLVNPYTLQAMKDQSLRVFAAFSRDQEDKHYVFHDIRRNGSVVWELLSQGAAIFVAGSSNRMPKDVKKALLQVARTHGNLSEEGAEEFFTSMVRSKRYIVEAW